MIDVDCQERTIFMNYNFKQVSEIITDAAIRADWKNVSFARDRMVVSVIFSNLFLEDSRARCESDFYIKYTCETECGGACYSKWNDSKTTEMNQDEWFAEVEKYFNDICGVNLNIEEKTA